MQLRSKEELNFIIRYFNLYSVDTLTEIYFNILNKCYVFHIDSELEVKFRELFYERLKEDSQ